MILHEVRPKPRRQRRSARGGVGRVRAGHAPAPPARRPRPPPLRSALELRGPDHGAARGHAGRAGLRRVPPDGGPRGAAGRRARRAGRERAHERRGRRPGPGPRHGDRPDRRRVRAHARRPARLHRAAGGAGVQARRSERDRRAGVARAEHAAAARARARAHDAHGARGHGLHHAARPPSRRPARGRRARRERRRSRGAELPLGEGVAGKVAQVGEATLVDDGAVIWLPIRVEDRIIGVVNLGKGAVSPMDLQFLSTLMAHVAYALENARLLEDARLNTERLQTVVEDLRTAQTRLVEGETVRALGQMASGMAHHLNNLLAVVSGRLQLLLLRAHDPALRKPLETAERAVGDAAEVVRRVLGFSAAQPVPETTRVDLNEIAADVIELTRPRWQDTAQLRQAMVDIRFEPGDDVVVVGEPAPLREVLMNLVLNALDAMPDGGCLAIRTWTEEGWAYCSVGDSGLGMSPDTRQRALEPFFTTKGPKGVGLGLSVTLGVVQRHRGEMDIQSREGAGTTVTLRIPRPGVTPPPDTVPLTPSPAAPLKILVVDDEPNVLEALADTLVEDGHTVLRAASGRDALALLDGGERVDVVITDLGMPGMTGWELARALRTRWPDLPVGLISGWTSSADFSAEEASHVAFVVAKPYTLGALRTALAPLRPRR